MSLKISDKETYQVILCSRTSSNTGTTNLNAVTYYCNWASMLPIEKYTKYSCSFVFKSEGYVGLLASVGFVNVDIGRTQIYDGTTQSSNLGMIYPIYLNASATALAQFSYYNSDNSDNNPVILYPSQNMVKVTLNTFAGGAMDHMPNYSLILNFTPCL